MIRLGTRRSPLALAQAGAVADALRGAGLEVAIVELVTTGDRDRAAPDKAKWTGELERALVAEQIDLAVHSAKDVPAALVADTALLGCPRRAATPDVLIGAAALEDLPHGARIGTASLRRAAQLRAARRDLEVVEIRGNVDTRIARLEDTGAARLDAIVLAAAGLERLGRTPEPAVALAGPTFVPAPGQGVVALQGRTGDPEAAAAAALIHDDETGRCLTAERALARGLGADCTSAVGAHATRVPGGEALRLRGFVGTPDGGDWAVDQRDGDDPEALGALLAQRLRAAGADDILAASFAQAPAPLREAAE